MTLDDAVVALQLAYPQVYMTCHTRHLRKKSSLYRLSARDGAILSHCDAAEPIAPSRLAAHLGVGRSTVSEAIKRLTRLGFLARAADSPTDRRISGVVLTTKGLAAISATSVLETERVRDVLESATPADRRAIVRGLTLLAATCRRSGDRNLRARR